MAAVLTEESVRRPETITLGKRVFYGLCLGEFGHELAAVPVLRKRVRGYEHVTVCSRPAREALYDGIAQLPPTSLPRSRAC